MPAANEIALVKQPLLQTTQRPLTQRQVRTALRDVWGRQAVWRPEDWPQCFKGLMREPRLRWRYRTAVPALTEIYSAGPVRDGANVIFRDFPMLSLLSRIELDRTLAALASKRRAA
jgi:hypothetical protein